MENDTTSRVFIDVTSVTRNTCEFTFFIITLLYYRILLRKKVFHSNLLFLLIIFPLSYIVALVPSIVRDVIEWFIILTMRQSEYVDMVIDIGQFSAGFNLLVLVSERAFASLFVTNYEFMCSKIPWLAIVLSSIQWSCTIVLLFINYYYSGLVLAALPLVIAVGISCLIATVVFAILPKISIHIYKREMVNHFGKVSRYQSIENLRSATILRRLVLTTVSFEVPMLSIYAAIRFLVDKPFRLYLLNIHYGVMALFATLLNFIVIFSHPTLLRELKKMVGIKKSRDRESIQICSIRGSRLDIPINDHGDAYFSGYRNSW